MPDHQPLPVAGYTPQNDEKVALANEGKALEERYLLWLDKLNRMATAPYAQLGGGPDNAQDLSDAVAIDKRCVAEARTCIQTGAMWAIRAIFKPQRMTLPEDTP